MNDDLRKEVEAVNSIYGDKCLVAVEDGVYHLHLPQQAPALRIQFPDDYPAAPPSVLGTQSSGEDANQGEASRVVDVFRDALGELFRSGEVCLFDVIEEVNSILGPSNSDSAETLVEESTDSESDVQTPSQSSPTSIPGDEPSWILSDVVTEVKSVFVARCAPVSSPEQASQYVRYFIDNNKTVRSPSHNTMAWRVKGDNGVSFQDCSQSAAGGCVLHLMQRMDLWNVMVVVSRWYGRHRLGRKRFSIINTVARDSFVKAGLVTEEAQGKKKGNR